jgi:hypothetical protein
MDRFRQLLVVPVLAVCTACAGIVVRTDSDPDAEFASLQRFAWLEPPSIETSDPFVDNTLLRKRVRQAVVRELSSRGYEQVEDPESADFLVTFHVTIEERLRFHQYPDSGYYGFHGRWVGWGGSTYAESYEEGTLILDLIRRRDRQLIWRGWGTDAVPTVDTDEERIDLAVEKILARFPPEREETKSGDVD